MKSTCDHPQQSTTMLIFPPKTNLKKFVPNRNHAQSWGRGYGDNSSPKQLRKSIFAQPEVLPTAVFCFLKQVNYVKSFLFFLGFTQSTAMCIYPGYLLFCSFKNFQLVKNLSWLSVDLFGQRIRNTLRNSMRQIWKEKQFYSNSKKNTGVSFASYSFPKGIYSVDLYNNASQPVFFLTQHWCDMV